MSRIVRKGWVRHAGECHPRFGLRESLGSGAPLGLDRGERRSLGPQAHYTSNRAPLSIVEACPAVIVMNCARSLSGANRGASVPVSQAWLPSARIS